MRNVVIFGAGLHANVCIDIFEKRGEFNIIGIIDSIVDIDSEIFGYKVIGRQDDIIILTEKYNIDIGFIAIGDNYSRKSVYDTVISMLPDFEFVNAIHPSVIIGRNVKIGFGIAMMAGVIVDSGSVIENFCVLNTASQLGHDCHMCDFSTIAGKSVAAAKVNFGKFSFISLGVAIADRINIGENTLIGIGSVLLKDTPDNVVIYGNPAKIIRNRKAGEKFLNSN